MRRMEQDTEQDRTDQADTNQKNACGKSESENRRRPDCGGKTLRRFIGNRTHCAW